MYALLPWANTEHFISGMVTLDALKRKNVQLIFKAILE